MGADLDLLARCICIDGWASSGKTTLARNLGVALGMPAIHTGMLYRATTLRWLSNAGKDWSELAEEASDPGAFRDCVSWPARSATGPDGIWDQEVTSAVSRVAKEPLVRTTLGEATRRFVRSFGPAILEGRDTGIAIVPEAKTRVFLECQESIRASRTAPSGLVAERDRADKTISNPETTIESYVKIDTSRVSALEATAIVVKLYAGSHSFSRRTANESASRCV